MSVRRTWLLMVWVGLTLSPWAAASPVASTAWQLENLRDVRDITGISVSPDGDQVAVTVLSSTAEGGQRHVWLTGRGLHHPIQLTFSSDTRGKGESEPAWSVDGRTVFFRSSRAGASRISRLELDHGSSHELDLHRDGAGRMVASWVSVASISAIETGRFALSRDGRWMAFVSLAEGKPSHPAPARHPRDDAFVVADEVSPHQQLHVLQLETMQVTTVALNGDEVQSLDWNADSRQLIAVTGHETDLDGYRGQLWRVSLNHPDAQRMRDVADTISNAVATANGVACLARCEEASPPECLQLFAWNRSSGRSQALTRGVRGSLSNTLIVERDGRHVVLSVMVGLTQKLARIDLRDHRMEWLDSAQQVVLGVATNAQRSAWGLLASSPSAPKTVLVTKSLSETAIPLPLPELVPANWPKVSPHHLLWHNAGWPVEGLLYLPDATGKATSATRGVGAWRALQPFPEPLLPTGQYAGLTGLGGVDNEPARKHGIWGRVRVGQSQRSRWRRLSRHHDRRRHGAGALSAGRQAHGAWR